MSDMHVVWHQPPGEPPELFGVYGSADAAETAIRQAMVDLAARYQDFSVASYPEDSAIAQAIYASAQTMDDPR